MEKGAGWKAPQGLWSAAACCCFHHASLLALTQAKHGQQAGLSESGSKLPHSKRPSRRKLLYTQMAEQRLTENRALPAGGNWKCGSED
jgi:hypothetical protein